MENKLDGANKLIRDQENKLLKLNAANKLLLGAVPGGGGVQNQNSSARGWGGRPVCTYDSEYRHTSTMSEHGVIQLKDSGQQDHVPFKKLVQVPWALEGER